jgi:hypothetical protein
MRTDRQTNMTKVKVAFRNFENTHLYGNYIYLKNYEVPQIFAPNF